MNKLILFLLITVIINEVSFSQTDSKNIIKDGLYLVIKTGSDTTYFESPKKTEFTIGFNKMFLEFADKDFSKVLIDTTEYVPLELDKLPTTEPQTELKKKLLISLTKEASEILKTFSAKHVMQKVVIVVDGEAVTMHKIREAITSGKLQITRCNDNACERIMVKLKDNIKVK